MYSRIEVLQIFGKNLWLPTLTDITAITIWVGMCVLHSNYLPFLNYQAVLILNKLCSTVYIFVHNVLKNMLTLTTYPFLCFFSSLSTTYTLQPQIFSTETWTTYLLSLKIFTIWPNTERLVTTHDSESNLIG